MGKYVRCKRKKEQFILEPTFRDPWFYQNEHSEAFQYALGMLEIPEMETTLRLKLGATPRAALPTNSPKEAKRITDKAGLMMRSYLVKHFPNRKRPSYREYLTSG